MRLLVANFFPAFHPPRSGGEQRYYYLYHHLSRHYDVTLLSPTYSHHPPEVVTYSPTFREHRVPKDPVFDRLHHALDAEGIGPECSAYVVALAGGTDTGFGQRFADLVAHHDVVVHESPFTLPYDRTFGTDGKPRVYAAYNVESHLAAQILRGDAGRTAVGFIRFLEESLAAAASLVLATCEEERRIFVSEFHVDPARTALAPNGFEPDAAGEPAPEPPPDGDAPYALFIGSAHPPNVEAARFLVEHVAPALPALRFRVIGAVCDRLPPTLPANVERLGFVPEVEKRRLLAGCAAALNPLFSGAGTNLKMLDYMAAGAPIVSTATGARGLALTHGVDVFLGDRATYVEALRAAVATPDVARAVGLAARRTAFAEYTWAGIADRVRESLEAMRDGGRASRRGEPRRRLLVVNDFPVAHATNGGQVRIRELLTELGRELDVVLLCFTSEARGHERAVAPGFTEITVPKTPAHRAAEAHARHASRVSVDDLVAAEVCTANDEFLATFRRLAARTVAVVFEHPYLAPLIDFLPASACVVYSSLNVESDLKAATLRARADAARRVAQAAALEDRLLDRADLVVCVSEEDRERFRRRRPDARYEVIVSGARPGVGTRPGTWNGGDPLHGRPFAVFVGSGHPPNVGAARFLVEDVAPHLPEVTFGIIGSVCDSLDAVTWPPNALRLGVLPEAEKGVLLARATLAANPLFDGGGSSLKVADFLASGLPLVSTRIGVRGYALRDGVEYLAADRTDFAAAIRRLVADDALRRRLAEHARAHFATVLDWRILGARYRRVLRALVAPDAGPRVLVVTYRFADPPPGGAEAFLVNVLGELARRETLAIDVATCDVGTITNKWHFSADYAPPDPRCPDPDYVQAMHRFPVDPPRVGDFAECARLFTVSMEEERAQAVALLPLFERPLLLGGWNYPETYGDGPARWTSREAQVFTGPGATALHVSGVAPQTTWVTITRGDTVVASYPAAERFDWTVELPGDDPIVTLRVSHAFIARNDPRELGVLVVGVALRTDGTFTPIDLRDDFAAAARRRAPDRWVRSLIEVATARDHDDDARFVAVRGPHARGLDRWLADNVATYDAVLVQGVPFATPAEVTHVAGIQGVPVVILPHFHMEDRYYHWQSYYDAFRRARCVIASSPGVKTLVFDALGATSVALPGGGVDPGEYDAGAALATRQRTFRALHASPTPFVLVLGRKAGSKHYDVAIEAVAAVNRDGHRVDLVLIGPEEDGAPVTAPHAFYYGAQDRDVVLGALSLALCLVNMSESESFGIVLLESWLSGRPVVAQRRCLAFADLVVSGENGVLAESATEVAEAVDAYLADPALAARHAANGRDLAADYSWARLAEQIEGVLLEAARPTTGPTEARTDHV